MGHDESAPGGAKSDLLSSLYGVSSQEIGVPVYYRVVRKIGEGASTVIVSAFHMSSREHVAIKIIDKASMTSRKVARASREAKILERLSHPNVIRLIETCENDRFLLIITECYSEGDLHQYLCQQRGFRLSERDARDKFCNIASALKYVHEQGFAHRDIKPENIFLGARGEAVLGDFGLATQFDRTLPINSSVGTLYYAAPELVVKNAQYIGPDVDAWALGVTFYALLSGRLPFAAPTADETRVLIARGQLDPIDGVTAVAMDIIRQLLCVDPQRRATMDVVMLHPFVAGVAPVHDVILNDFSGLLTDSSDADEPERTPDAAKRARRKDSQLQNRSHSPSHSKCPDKAQPSTSYYLRSNEREVPYKAHLDDSEDERENVNAKKKERNNNDKVENSWPTSLSAAAVEDIDHLDEPDLNAGIMAKFSSTPPLPQRKLRGAVSSSKLNLKTRLLFRRDAPTLSQMADESDAVNAVVVPLEEKKEHKKKHKEKINESKERDKKESKSSGSHHVQQAIPSRVHKHSQ